jgi:hypothetical protein
MHATDLIGINDITRVLLVYTCQQGVYPRGHVIPLRLLSSLYIRYKTFLSVVILWSGRACALLGQVSSGSVKETVLSHAQSLGCYRHSRCHPKSHLRHENRRQIGVVVADKISQNTCGYTARVSRDLCATILHRPKFSNFTPPGSKTILAGPNPKFTLGYVNCTRPKPYFLSFHIAYIKFELEYFMRLVYNFLFLGPFW